MPQIRPLADIVHSKYLITHTHASVNAVLFLFNGPTSFGPTSLLLVKVRFGPRGMKLSGLYPGFYFNRGKKPPLPFSSLSFSSPFPFHFPYFPIPSSPAFPPLLTIPSIFPLSLFSIPSPSPLPFMGRPTHLFQLGGLEESGRRMVSDAF